MVGQRTIVLLDKGLIDDVVVVHVGVHLVVVQIQLDDVVHRDEAVEVTGRPGAPVLPHVGEHVDVVSQEEKLCTPEQDRERPCPLTVPFQRRGQLATDLHRGSSQQSV